MQQSLALPRELTICTVAELRALWLSRRAETGQADVVRPAQSDPWEVDAAAVEEVDAAGIELLLSLSHALAREHRELRLSNPSQRLADGCSALGLSALLAAPQTYGAAK